VKLKEVFCREEEEEEEEERRRDERGLTSFWRWKI
jgi:hypothetical protein